MAAPKGNQFWKLRSKHGRNKLFADSELLWAAACEYFQWCNDNPWTREETTIRGENIDVKTIPTDRPFTLSGLCIYLDCNTQYFSQFKKTLTDKDKDFSLVVTRIEETIYTQKFEGAAVGAFNANIIARDLGLKDKSEVEQKTDMNLNLSKEIIKKISDNLDENI